MIKALFFDIDGTLVSFSTHEIPASALQAIKAAKAKGVKIFISTGRPKAFLTSNLDVIRPLVDGYITNNGALVEASDEIVEKQKTLQAGTCLAFGQAFKIPLIVKLEIDNNSFSFSVMCFSVLIFKLNFGLFEY